jgi:hypothetical protein
MAIETIGGGCWCWLAGPGPLRWGPRDGMKRRRECVYGGELDLATLVWTRGATFPLVRLSRG